MTKKTPKPTPAHMQKLADLMDTRPEGVSLRQVQNTLSVSPTLAKAALIEIGATEVDGKWVFADVEQSGNAGELAPETVTIAESAPVEPVTIEPEPVTIERAQTGRIVAPDDATHQNLQDGCFYKAVDGAAYYFSFDDEAWWACGATAHDLDVAAHVIRLPVESKPQPELKKLTQAVFDGLPVEYRWAVIGKNGAALAWVADPVIENGLFWATPAWDWTGAKLIGRGYDTSNWRNSKIERLSDTCIDDMGIANFQKECQRVADQQAKSDFALALEAERQRVYDAVAIGGTAERLAELTGLHVDDVQMHLDVLIDDGAIVERPIVVAISYRVAV